MGNSLGAWSIAPDTNTVSGPFVEKYETKGPAAGPYVPTWHVYDKLWYRQKKPYKLPLTFSLDRCNVTEFESANGGYIEYHQTGAWLWVKVDGTSHAQKVAYEDAYQKLIRQVKPDNAALGALYGERHAALRMIRERSDKIRDFVVAVRRFQFRRAAVMLGLTSPPGGLRRDLASFGNNVLEYSFGWAPLISDISGAISVLQRGVPPVRIKVSSVVPDRSSGSSSPSGWTDQWSITGSNRVVLGCDIYVDNPNLFLANQLGLVNLASVAVELMPFSFIVDYFVNVSEFLSSFTDLWGVRVLNPYRQYKTDYTISQSAFGPTVPYRGWTARRRGNMRITGPLPGPTLRIREPWVLSPQRALTSVSLLLQQLGRR